MERSDTPEPDNSKQERPVWSVLAGEFDLDNPTINSTLVARIADKFWFAPHGSDGRRRLQAIELVLRAYELCGLDRLAVQQKVTDTILELKDYSKQIVLSGLTPELGIKSDEENNDEALASTPSPVMNALRTVIVLSNNVESITVHDIVRTEKDKWLVDGNTRHLAEAVVRTFYLEEKGLTSADIVE